MRLTNFLREAFVRAAIADVPKIDYQEQAHKYARAIIKDRFKEKFPELDYEAAAKSGWFKDSFISLPYHLSNIHAPVNCGSGMLSSDPPVWKKLEEFSKLKQEEDAKISALRSKLEGVAAACTTRKQLLEALPEFESYLPAEEAKAAKNLPAVANVLSDFVKAGWPKNQPKMPKANP
jgi:hypothetical protein